MPKVLTIAQACRATGLSRYTMTKIVEQYNIGHQIKTASGYTKYLVDPAKLAKVVPITRRDVLKATEKE